MDTRKLLTATALSLPLLALGMPAQAGAQPAHVLTQAPASAPAPDVAAPAPKSDVPQLPTVADPCAGVCKRTVVMAVQHPKFGEMGVTTYLKPVGESGAHARYEPVFVLYQGGRPVGHYTAWGARVTHFGPEPASDQAAWSLANNRAVDRYGNVFLSYDDGGAASHGGGVVVLTPTDWGWDTRGTMPTANGTAPFRHADLTIDAAGEATITLRNLGEQGGWNNEVMSYRWDGTEFAEVEKQRADVPQLPTVADPCTDACQRTGVIPVQHPKFGAMSVGTSVRPVGDSFYEPRRYEPTFVLFQDGRPVGHYTAWGAHVTHFGTTPPSGAPSGWSLANNAAVDRHGNVFLSWDDAAVPDYGSGVVVLTPTDWGYDTRGTMPTANGAAQFRHADLTIDAAGEATITQKVLGEQGVWTENYTWNGTEFAPRS